MGQGTRGRYTLAFQQEAVRMVESDQTMAAAACSLGVVEQTLGIWIKLHRAGRLKGASGGWIYRITRAELGGRSCAYFGMAGATSFGLTADKTAHRAVASK